MRTLQTDSRVKNGLAGIVIVVLVIVVGQTFSAIPQLFAQPTYYGQFADSAGVNPGDKVRIAGMEVGTVKSLAILLALASSCLNCSSRLPMVSENRATPSNAALRCG